MSVDIVTRIHNFGIGQANLARQVMRSAEEEVEYWGGLDGEDLAAAFREELAMPRRKILAEAAAKARPMLERAAEARRDLLLHRPDVEGRDSALWFDDGYKALRHAATQAHPATPEMTGPMPADLAALPAAAEVAGPVLPV
jgi:hypothetical protein